MLARFPGVTSTGGYNPNVTHSWDEHQTGEAVDFMVSSKADGDRIVAYCMQNAEALGVRYCIWQQRMWYPDGTTEAMAERPGGPTANHMDHVHVRFKAGANTGTLTTEPSAPGQPEWGSGRPGRPGRWHRHRYRHGHRYRHAAEQGRVREPAAGAGHRQGHAAGAGIPDVFGKDPTQWGLTKLLMGGLGTGRASPSGHSEPGGRQDGGGGANRLHRAARAVA